MLASTLIIITGTCPDSFSQRGIFLRTCPSRVVASCCLSVNSDDHFVPFFSALIPCKVLSLCLHML